MSLHTALRPSIYCISIYQTARPTDEAEVDPQEQGKAIIGEVASQVGLDEKQYKTRILVSEDVTETILDAVEAYDTICVGSTRQGALSQALFGSIPETIGEQVSATVAMVRGAEESPRSIREAVVEHLTP